MSEIVPRHQLPSGGFGQSRSMRQIATNYGRYGAGTVGRSDITYDSSVLDSSCSGGRCRAPHPEAAMPLHSLALALVPRHTYACGRCRDSFRNAVAALAHECSPRS